MKTGSSFSLLSLLFQSKKNSRSLPTGPLKFPIIGNLIWLHKSFTEFESIIHSLHRDLSPMITLHIGSHPNIFSSSNFYSKKYFFFQTNNYEDRLCKSSILFSWFPSRKSCLNSNCCSPYQSHCPSGMQNKIHETHSYSIQRLRIASTTSVKLPFVSSCLTLFNLLHTLIPLCCKSSDS